MKLILILFVVCSMSCSGMAKKAVLGAILPAGESKPLVAVETVVGNKSEALVGSVDTIGSRSEVKAEVITGGVVTSYVQQVPLTFMLLLILGWLLPSPSSMWNGIVKVFKRGDKK